MQDNNQPTPPQNQTPPVPINPYFAPQPVEALPVAPLPPTVPIITPGQPINSVPPVPPTPKPKNKKLRKRLLVGLGALVVIVAAVIIVPKLIEVSSVSALEAQFAKNSNYDYKPTQYDVDPGKTFSFKVNYDADSKFANSDDPSAPGSSAPITVYYDSAFTKVVHNIFYNTTTNSHVIEINPPSAEKGENSSFIETALSNEDQWGLHDQYYIVQKDDANGNALKRPIVTPFTVKKALETPQVAYSVDSSGVAQVKWSKIDGATKYYVVQFKTDPTDGSVTDTIIGQTTDTSWASSKDETTGVTTQNDIFKNYAKSVDDLHGNDTSPLGGLTGQGVQPVDYGVIASNDKDFSAYMSIDGTSLQAQLPIQIAQNAKKQANLSYLDDVQTFDQFPTEMPVTMANGSTVEKAVDVLKDLAQERTVKNGDGVTINVIYMPYVVRGTLITSYYYIQKYDSNWKSEVDRIATRNDTTQAKTGALASFSYTGTITDFDHITVSKSAPAVDYKINATNPMTAYIAANMLKGNQYIDMSQYTKAANHPDVTDAAQEAQYQNPYAVDVTGVYYYQQQNILQVKYNLTSDARVTEQKAIAAEAKKVIGQIITPGMSDRDKALAINNYLDSSASYNYAAFDAMQADPFDIPDGYKDSWTAAGILIDKSGVCASYAQAFKILADEAGLTSVFVDGIANGGPHAWDKVKMDGKWQVVDPTWDDDGTTNNTYFGLTDAQALAKDHTQDSDFVIDSLVSQYAAN